MSFFRNRSPESCFDSRIDGLNSFLKKGRKVYSNIHFRKFRGLNGNDLHDAKGVHFNGKGMREVYGDYKGIVKSILDGTYQ